MATWRCCRVMCFCFLFLRTGQPALRASEWSKEQDRQPTLCLPCSRGRQRHGWGGVGRGGVGWGGPGGEDGIDRQLVTGSIVGHWLQVTGDLVTYWLPSLFRMRFRFHVLPKHPYTDLSTRTNDFVANAPLGQTLKLNSDAP